LERDQKIKSQVGDHVVIVATWESLSDKKITIQDFIQNGESFIPVFTSLDKAKAQTKGSAYTDKLVEIKTDFLASLLKGPEILVFDPADGFDLRITAKEFQMVRKQ
jgi:hypothetical protein